MIMFCGYRVSQAHGATGQRNPHGVAGTLFRRV